MKSCIYEGRVKHHRNAPVSHAFSYRLFMMYVDLDELPDLFRGRWLWSAERRALARFDRRDHLGNPQEPLANSVRGEILRQTGRRHTGPIGLLTHFRYFSYCFNPVSFYYCFDPTGEQLEWIVAEVTNTPWGERTCYVIPAEVNGRTGLTRYQPDKKMHVSPYIEMDVSYDWHLTSPADKLSVFMAVSKGGAFGSQR